MAEDEAFPGIYSQKADGFAQGGERWVSEDSRTSVPWMPQDLAFELPGSRSR